MSAREFFYAYADLYRLRYLMANVSTSSGTISTTSQSPGVSTSSKKRRSTSSGVTVGHHTSPEDFERAKASFFGRTGALLGGLNVIVETMSNRYACVKVDGPGRFKVLAKVGLVSRFVSACATSNTCYNV